MNVQERVFHKICVLSTHIDKGHNIHTFDDKESIPTLIGRVHALQLLRNKNKFLPFCCVINIKTCQSVGGLLSFVLIATSPSGQSSNSTVD